MQSAAGATTWLQSSEMNRLHGIICSLGRWGRVVERELLGSGLSQLDPGDDVLEIGQGFGAMTPAPA